MSKSKAYVTQLLSLADIQLNGNNPWDIQVNSDAFYDTVIKNPSLGLGETYMHGWWNCQNLDEFFYRIMRVQLEDKIKADKRLLSKLFVAKFINLQTKSRAFEVGRKHYDLGNQLYSSMLDSRLTYTCGYWKNTDNLEDAQRDKLDLVCRKLQLQPGMRVLDIGCGWGSFAKYAAENYSVSVVGITISKEQYEYAKESCAGLPVEIRLQDYRDVDTQFDRAVSLGMFEHVGHLNYRKYFNVISKCLVDEGLFLLHTIGANASCAASDAWINKYIFPNGMLPSIAQIGRAMENLFVMEDWHNFGSDYDKTLIAWRNNFIAAWDKLAKSYDERFYRMWLYYLNSCAGMFRARKAQLWQIVLSKNGLEGGYARIS